MNGWRLALGFLAVLVVWGCAAPESGEPPGSEEIPVEDVGQGLEIDTSADRREVRTAGRLAGVLPADFPSELPLHLPASLVELEPGRAAIFLTSDALPTVRDGLLARLRAGGWTVRAEGPEWTVRRGETTARLRVEEARPGTRYRWAW